MEQLARVLGDEEKRVLFIEFLEFLTTASRSELAEMDRLLGEAKGEGPH
jgi:hypothetical protein